MRLRKSSKKGPESLALKMLDVGFSILKIDRSNRKEVCYTPDAVSQDLLAKREPLRAVFRDAGFASDSVKINVEQIFKLMSPSTAVNTI